MDQTLLPANYTMPTGDNVRLIAAYYSSIDLERMKD